MDRRWNRNVVSLLPSVTTEMRLPISLLWSPVIALANSEDHYILQMFLNFYLPYHIFRHFSTDIFETLSHGVTLVSAEPLL